MLNYYIIQLLNYAVYISILLYSGFNTILTLDITTLASTSTTPPSAVPTTTRERLPPSDDQHGCENQQLIDRAPKIETIIMDGKDDILINFERIFPMHIRIYETIHIKSYKMMF